MSEENEYQKYWNDVKEMAESLAQEIPDRVKEGEDVYDIIHESIDGSARVIYTWQAKMCLVHSDNEDAYFNEIGPEGATDETGINWSGLAFMAFKADVMDRLESDGFDVNDEDNWMEEEEEEEEEEEASKVDPNSALGKALDGIKKD